MASQEHVRSFEGGSGGSGGGWPLSFTLVIPEEPNDDREPRAKPVWWNYNLYRGPHGRKPQLLYARTKEESERIAYFKFLEEDHKVVGFDLEWPCYIPETTRARLQDRVGLITIASEDTIALFHVGAHEGAAAADLLAPSLQRLIESPAVLKAGVGVLSADFRRLQKFFGLRPQGAVELSHLHSLVVSDGPAGVGGCTTKTVALDKLVRAHLGLPLDKGNSRVRMSNWSRKILSLEQRAYAANDAYAGFMLYHYLETRRQQLEPVPPRPLCHEKYDCFDHIPGRGTRLLLQLEDEEAEEDGLLRVITVADFFAGRTDHIYTLDPAQVTRRSLSPDPAPEPAPRDSTRRGINDGRNLPATPTGRRRRAAATSAQSRPSSVRKNKTKPASTLLRKLKDHRERIAKQRRWELYMVAQNSVLEEIAQKRPTTMPELMNIKGMGQKRRDKFGAAFLNIVLLHQRQEESDNAEERSPAQDNGATSVGPSEQGQRVLGDHTNVRAAEPSTAEPATPTARRRPQLHTEPTPAVQWTGLGTRDEPIGLEDSDGDGPESGGSPLAGRGSASRPSSSTGRSGRPVRNPYATSVASKSAPTDWSVPDRHRRRRSSTASFAG